MINAKEAWRKTLLQTKYKEFMSRIEDAIEKNIKDGYSFARIDVSDTYVEVVQNIIMPELATLGYSTELDPAKPKPLACPSDQWYSTNTLKVSWEVA